MEMDDIKEVPVIRLDKLTDEQRRAYMLAHNKLTMNSDFDISLLQLELDGISQIDMSEFGFDLDIDDDDFVDIQKKDLAPYKKVHYLITVDINNNDKIIDFIDALRKMEDVEVESTLN